MKAFSFRLEQALRWRETQVRVQKSRLAAAAGHTGAIQTMLDLKRVEAARGAEQIVREPTGVALASYAGFIEKSRASIRGLETNLAAAQGAFTLEMDRLADANRKLRLLENLKLAGQSLWQKEFDRELGAFADEAFLRSIQSKKRTGA